MGKQRPPAAGRQQEAYGGAGGGRWRRLPAHKPCLATNLSRQPCSSFRVRRRLGLPSAEGAKVGLGQVPARPPH